MEFHEPESSQIISSINTGQRRKHEEESDINELDVEPDFKVLNKKQRIIGLHPNGIKPLGNLYLTDQNEENLATSGLGTLKVLSEEQLVDILMFDKYIFLFFFTTNFYFFKKTKGTFPCRFVHSFFS